MTGPVLAAPAGAVTQAGTQVSSRAGAHHRVATKARIVFVKNEQNPFASKVVWRQWQRSAGGWRLVDTAEWRAGSGLGGARGRSSCVRNVGWLPNGTYTARPYTDYHGNVIHGRAFRLSNHACGRGTVRHNLFLHTETGPGNHQCANRPGDQACRWEFPAINDYRSNGCIKLSPTDIAALMRHYRRWAAHARAVDLHRFRLVVTG
ncbi:hypothetical protein D9V37_19785 [Nocardioides mangrovicus]|uniref:YkuD domain-containing protein n=1 Tax=Nocardioides mangrovicus TaxID=2478913 RepID=A0A3L8P048_9ACTN|nr:hypothetical protein D9V37_19785 [Nocardioides mangrovicus]